MMAISPQATMVISPPCQWAAAPNRSLKRPVFSPRVPARARRSDNRPSRIVSAKSGQAMSNQQVAARAIKQDVPLLMKRCLVDDPACFASTSDARGLANGLDTYAATVRPRS